MPIFSMPSYKQYKYKPVFNEENREAFSIDGYLKFGQRHDLVELSGHHSDKEILRIAEGVNLIFPTMEFNSIHLQIDGEDRYLYLSPLESHVCLFGAIAEDQVIDRRIIRKGEFQGRDRGYTADLKITVNIRTAQVQMDLLNQEADRPGVVPMGFKLMTVSPLRAGF